MGKDYYNILGVNKTATHDEIKKAFRKKAHEFHPDKKSGNEAKFKEINEAYQVLGDSKKRSQYDQFGSTFEDAQRQGGYSGFDGFRDASGYANGFNVNMDDLGDIFGGIGDIFGFGGGSRRRTRSQGSDLQVIVTISFEEAAFGVEKELNLQKKVKCSHCNGNLAEPGTKITNCTTCKGTGRVTRVQRTILGNMQVQAACETCGGEGKTYEKKCTKCGGSGTMMDKVNLTVKIPAGIDDGESIRLSGQGEAGEQGAPAGDLYLRVRVISDKRFERHGFNIKSTAEISFTQAGLGAKIEVETIDGKVELKIPSGTQSGTVFKLRARGVTRLQSTGRGDHYVEVIVKTPTKLTRNQKKLLEELDK